MNENECPVCKAAPGQTCLSVVTGKASAPHHARTNLAAGFGAPSQREEAARAVVEKFDRLTQADRPGGIPIQNGQKLILIVYTEQGTPVAQMDATIVEVGDDLEVTFKFPTHEAAIA